MTVSEVSESPEWHLQEQICKPQTLLQVVGGKNLSTGTRRILASITCAHCYKESLKFLLLPLAKMSVAKWSDQTSCLERTAMWELTLSP